jgi:hypothetical protein
MGYARFAWFRQLGMVVTSNPVYSRELSPKKLAELKRVHTAADTIIRNDVYPRWKKHPILALRYDVLKKKKNFFLKKSLIKFVDL